MFRFISRNSRLLSTCQKSSLRKAAIDEKFQFFRWNPSSSFSSIQTIGKTASNGATNANPDEFTVNYLTESCSFSEKQALSLSKFVTLEAPDRPDSVLALLRKHGMSVNQIASVILKYPRILLSSPEKTILPKIEFLKSVGFPDEDISKLLGSRVAPLTRSLQSQIIPGVNFLQRFLVSNEYVVQCVLKCPEILLTTNRRLLLANIELLRELGVPEPNIQKAVRRLPKFLLLKSAKVKESAQRLEDLGIDTQTMIYVRCLSAMATLSPEIWEEKLAVYKRWGCSEDEVLLAFAKHPACMTVSGEKIADIMEFLVDKMGFDPLDVFRAPTLFSLSVKERIIPRCTVYALLVKKGLVTWRNTALARLLLLGEQKFLEEFIECFKDDVVELLKVYKETRISGSCAIKTIQLPKPLPAPPPPLDREMEGLSEEEKKALRGSKFAPLPSAPPPRHQPRLAHPGGPMKTNKAAALAKFLERKLQEPNGLASVDPRLVELAVRNAKETVNSSGTSTSGRTIHHVDSFRDSEESAEEELKISVSKKRKKKKKKLNKSEKKKSKKQKKLKHSNLEQL
ncbi:OLC1v1020370C1 [Oldenlandia corymbosa var. corymbosa]|uniref:OLC1v1020370C1 n=1 Tax=Oldenlandia corymbosa var. corymbosa TaxID=529605 RepID=A0AAV1EG76_OLDCO|nr:OLC1v1020370C1 [Oldenlandia corymbosa var. corymbosa]